VRAVAANDNKALFAINTNLSYLVSLKKGIICGKNKSILIKNISQISDGHVLLSTSDTLFDYALDRGDMKTVTRLKSYSCLFASKETILAGSFKDLYEINSQIGESHLWLKDFYFNDLKKLSDILFAGATSGNGIILMNPNRIVRRLTTSDGLVSNEIQKLFVENSHTLWASTNSGLIRLQIDGQRLAINNYSRMDGLPSDQVADYYIRNDTAFVGTAKCFLNKAGSSP